MAVDWISERTRRADIMARHGQYVGVYNRNWEPVVDVEDLAMSASFPATLMEVGSMSMTIKGEIKPGVRSPVVDYLLNSTPGEEMAVDIDLNALIHSAEHIVVERPGAKRRCYRVLDLIPKGGRDNPRELTITGVDTLEHIKHIPLWADPSNRSKLVQLQFSDIQQGSVEVVSRKLIGRNLHGYQQPSLLFTSFSWTDTYSNPSQWVNVQSDLHSVIVSPVPSGLPSEWTILEARWDNAYDLLKASWEASGVMPFTWLWLPGDPQPFSNYTTLIKPTVIIDFKPVSTVAGVNGPIGHALGAITRLIDNDRISSMYQFNETSNPTANGVAPWVVFDLVEAPEIHVRKSTDHTFLVGGQSPKGLNDVIKVGAVGLVRTVLSVIPGIGTALSELISAVTGVVAEMAADRFLNINEYTDDIRKAYHGRAGFKSVSKTGQANTTESLQKAWQAKTETDGGVSIVFTVDDSGAYVPGRDFNLGDNVGVRAWGQVWAGYISELTWTSEPGKYVGWTIKVGNLASLRNPAEMQAIHAETIRAVIGRMATFVSS